MGDAGTRLKNGDIGEIITQKNSHPSLDWLNFVDICGKTGFASGTSDRAVKISPVVRLVEGTRRNRL